MISCSNQGEEEIIIPFAVIHTGVYSAIGDKREVVIKNNEDYQKLMAEVYNNLDQMPQIPDVDFSKNYVVAMFMGSRNTGGYTLKFDKVIKRADDLTVSAYETSPGKTCIVTEAISQPYEIIKIPRIEKKVKFIRKQKVNECQ